MSDMPEIHAGPAPVTRPARSGSRARAPLAFVGAGLLLVAAGLLLVPPEATLGGNVRMVFFHGAVTWNGILMACAAGAAGLFALASGRGRVGHRSQDDAPPDASGVMTTPRRGAGDLAGFLRTTALFRLLSLATAFWVLSLTLSFPVMIRTWGGVLWNEPKLLMSAELVSLFLVCWAVSFFVGRPRVTAVAALVSVSVMVALLSVTPGAFHPDNPIMGSGNPRFIGTFAAILAGLVVASLGVAFMRRVAPGGGT